MQGLFLYNLESGRGRIASLVDQILTIFRGRGYDLEPQLIDFERGPFVAGCEPEIVVVAGGDGTVNYVVNSMRKAGIDPLLGIIPAGTANDFAGALGISHSPLKAARQIADSEEVAIDCGRVNDIYFVNIFSFGVFTTTSQRTPNELKHRIGKLAYLIEGVKEVTDIQSTPLRVRANGLTLDLNSQLVLIFNGVTAGGFKITRRASLTDGCFEVMILEKRNLILSSFAIWQYLLGGNPEILHYMKVDRLDIESAVETPTDVDGQPGAQFPLRIECLKGNLRVLCPREKGASKRKVSTTKP